MHTHLDNYTRKVHIFKTNILYIESCYKIYPFYTYLLSILHHILCYTDQSRGYRYCYLCNILHTVGYNYLQTTILCTLLKKTPSITFVPDIKQIKKNITKESVFIAKQVYYLTFCRRNYC